MGRAVAAVVAGLVAWFVIATLGNLAIRAAWPGYAAVEVAMSFTAGMLLARLFLGIVASLGAGFIAAWIVRRHRRAVVVLAGLLLVMFIPVHYGLWDRFPIWYHLVFLISLAVMTPLGALLVRD